MDPFIAGINRRKGPSKGKIIFLLVLLVQLVLVGAYWRWQGGKDDNAGPEVKPEQPVKKGATSAKATAAAFSPQAEQLLTRAHGLRQADQPAQARDALYKLLEMNLPEARQREVIALLGEVNIQLLCSPIPMAGKEYYAIQSGDSLDRIARKFKTTIALLKKMNGMTSDQIRRGERMLVFSGLFTIQVKKSTNEMDLLLDGALFKRYRVGTGKFNKTPAVEFTIIDKIENPAWWKDGKVIEYGDPENVLGSRWMKIESATHPEIKGYGIHGTKEPESIGKQSSAGCIRMLNEEVEELFDLVPRNTLVTIAD
ncbi:MAG: L,D-transpeptidase family protein [Kiritimatiellales bacterium]|nr:L,D-transpeptidase family protein [Kiritimatiellales bacterium]